MRTSTHRWLWPFVLIVASCTTLDTERLLKDTHRAYAYGTPDSAIAGIPYEEIQDLSYGERVVIAYREDPARRTVTVRDAKYGGLVRPLTPNDSTDERRRRILAFDPVLPSLSLWRGIDSTLLAAHTAWAGVMVLREDYGGVEERIPIADIESVIRAEQQDAYDDVDLVMTIFLIVALTPIVLLGLGLAAFAMSGPMMF